MNMSVFQAVTELELASSSTMHFHIPNLLERRVVKTRVPGGNPGRGEQKYELKTTPGLNDGKNISRIFWKNPDNHFYFKISGWRGGYTHKCGLYKWHYRLGHFQNTKSSDFFAKKEHLEMKFIKFPRFMIKNEPLDWLFNEWDQGRMIWRGGLESLVGFQN